MTGCVEVGVPRGQPPDAAQVPHILSSRRPAGGPRRGLDLGMRSRVPAGKVPPRLARTGSRACTHRPRSPRGSRQDRKDWEDLVPTRSPSPLPVWWGGVPQSPCSPHSSPSPPHVPLACLRVGFFTALCVPLSPLLPLSPPGSTASSLSLPSALSPLCVFISLSVSLSLPPPPSLSLLHPSPYPGVSPVDISGPIL